MCRTRRQFTIEFKRQCVERLERGECSANSIEREHGLHQNQIYKWRKMFKCQPLVQCTQSQDNITGLKNQIRELENLVVFLARKIKSL